MSTPIRTPGNRSTTFFDTQFRAQVERGEYALNPFETAVLPLLGGDVLDLGCGLGNLALEAAAAGCRVTALDASTAAIADLRRRTGARGLALEAHAGDLRHFVPWGSYDCVVSIGLLMFFECAAAHALLARLVEAVRPGGLLALNVLVEGTTYLEMFTPGDYCLFAGDALLRACPGWPVLLSRHDRFAAPGGTLKCFHTVAARCPG